MRIPNNLDRPWLNEEWLYDQYILQNKTTHEISKEVNCSKFTISFYINKYGFKKDRYRTDKLPYQQYDFLYKSHIIDKKSMSEIARECGVSSDTIRYNMQRFDIEPWRSHPPHKLTKFTDEIIFAYLSENQSAYQLGQYYHCGDGPIRTILRANNIEIRNRAEAQFVYNNKEIDPRLDDKDWLYKRHVIDKISSQDIAKELGVDPGTVRRHMRKVGIEPRNNSESKVGLMVGENHPNWKGGLSPFFALLREYTSVNINPKILARDHYSCQLCGNKHFLHVHHIVAFSKIVSDIINEHPEYDVHRDQTELYEIIIKDPRFLDENNLITYCKFCHWFRIHKYKQRSISSQALEIREGSETIESID